MTDRLALCALALALFAACRDSTSPRPPLEFTQLSAGNYYTCGVATNGTAYCWGALGTALAAPQTRPTPLSVELSFLSVTAGGDHACGIASGGVAYCWGENSAGQLGLGFADSLPHPAPARVATALTFASLSAGSGLTCGVTTGGEAYCWGVDWAGELGSTATTGESCRLWSFYSGSIQAPCSTSPVPVAGGHAFAMVSAGVGHACGVTTDGAAYCWGGDRYGELGNGWSAERCAGEVDSFPCSRVPAPVAGALRFAAVGAGGLHTCGVTVGGQTWCWGEDRYGQLGTTVTTAQCDNVIPCSTVPVPAAAGLSFTSLSAGLEHTCGVTTAGAAYCWGDNFWGQLGNPAYSGEPGPVAGSLTFRSVSAGSEHTCGITTSGAAYCWGLNDFGQLGNGTTSYTERTPVRVVGP